MKNPSPRIIALNTSLAIGAVALVAGVLFHWLVFGAFHWAILLIAVAVSGLAYWLIYWYVEQFVYRKIKLIYKNIHELKAPKEGEQSKKLVSQFTLKEAEHEVMEWAKNKSAEIDQLKRMAEYRKEFLGNVSHELKTPIFNIQGYLHTLIDGGVENPKINMDYLIKAAKNVERLNHIVDDLNLISEFEAGVLQLELTTFDIVPLIKEVFETLEMQAAAKDIKLEIKEGMDKPVEVQADPNRIRQALVNLVENSIKYGKTGGKTLVGIYDMDENILIEVTDNGIGIDQAHLPRLFERFYRVDKSRSRAEGGTGLGLSIVKHIIEAHGQTVNVRSTVGVGSTFGFTLKKAR